MTEFKINAYLTLKLEDGLTVIYVGGERFHLYCKPFLLSIPIKNVELYSDAQTLEEADEVFSKTADKDLRKYNKEILELIDEKTEFWGHCSNLHAWVDSEYNSSLLVYNLSFPLLKKLANAGDPLAKKRYKDEICYRFVNGDNISAFLILNNFLNDFSLEEIDVLIEETISKGNFSKDFKEDLWALIGHSKKLDGFPYFKRALDLNLGSNITWRYLATYYYLREEFAKAKNAALNALKIDKDDHYSLSTLGLLCHIDMDLDQAIQLFERANLIKDDFDYRIHLGYLYNKRGFYKKALEYYELCEREIAELNASEVKTLVIGRFNNYYALWKLDKARDYFFKISESDHSPQLLCDYAVICREFKRYDEGLYYLERAYKLDPHFKRIFILRGNLYELKKEEEKALISYKKYLELEPDDTNVISFIYHIYKENADDIEAEAFVEEYLNPDETNEKKLLIALRLYDDKMEFEKEQGVKEKLLFYAKKVLVINPSSFIANGILARLLINDRLYQEAIAPLKKRLEFLPFATRLFSDLAYAYYKTGQDEKALALITPSFEHDSDESNYEKRWTNLLNLFIKDEKFDRAQQVRALILKQREKITRDLANLKLT